MYEGFKSHTGMTIKFSATLKPERRKDKQGDVIMDNVPLLVDIAYNGNRFFLTTGFRIDASKWNPVARKVNPNTVHPKGFKAKEINDGAAGLINDIKNTFIKFGLTGTIPTVGEFKQALNPKREPETNTLEKTEIKFFDSFDAYIEQGKNKWQPNTLKKHYTTKKHLKDFDSDLTFEKLNNSETLDAFVSYLNKEGEEGSNKKALRNISAEKYLKVLKWFLKWAVVKKHTAFNDFLTYKPSLENIDKEVIFLTQSEFTHLYNLDIKLDYQKRIRDVFCFSCVTGLRYSDIYNLKASQIKDGVIHLTTVKTNQKLKIHLNKYSIAILDKYKDFNFEGGKALPVISNQNCNIYLKEVCKLAGFNDQIEISYKIGNERKDEVYPKYELMSMHAGRRTFVCLGLLLGLPTKVIMSFTGHSSIEAMKPYEKIVEELKHQEMNKFNF